MIRIGDLYGTTKPATPGSSTPTTDLEPSLPSATTTSNYTPDLEYGNYQEKPVVSKQRHRFFQVIDVGVITRNAGNALVIASPLTIAAGLQVFEFQDPPEKVIVGILANNGANAELDVWIGDGGGFPVRLGNGGKVVIPLEGESRVSFRAVGQSIKGTIVGVSGYSDNELDFIPASQP